MRKVLVLVTVLTLGFAGGLFAGPKLTNKGHLASTATGLDIFGITERPRDLPEQSYPAH